MTEQERNDAPQCPKCGYTQADADLHGDHRLCDGEIPPNDFVLCSVLAFDDGSISVQLLHRGAKASCVEVGNLINALSYNGPKRVVESCVRWMPFAAYQEAVHGRINDAKAIEDLV